jgi:hypothetical protein
MTGAGEKPSTAQPNQTGQGTAPRTGTGTGEKAAPTGQAPTGQAQPNRTGAGTGTGAGERTGAGAGERTGAGAGAGAGRAGNVNISTEQRTQIRSTIMRGNVNRVTSLNVRVAIGTALPRDVVIRPLPPEIITIVPQYRGYDYVVYNEEIIIIEPSTREIVYIIEG